MQKLRYIGQENADTRFHDGALRMVSGACHIQVMRANREHPEFSQGTDYTYNHAPMLCRWHGMMYLMYLSSPVDEHGGHANALLMRSRDGFSWSQPEKIFHSLPVPEGVYCGQDAEKLAYPAWTVVHHRMGFYRAPNDVLLVMTHHGVCPHVRVMPNSGYGMGRVVRRIYDDGTLGDPYVLRINSQAGWKKEHFPYPWYEESCDEDFVAACRALLKDQLANGAWWEEERLDTDFFPLAGMRAPSFCTLPDGHTMAVGKVGMMAVSEDQGKSWTKPEKAEGVITSGGKCALMRTGDGRYAMVYNPSPDSQHRWPLAVTVSEDGYQYDHMCCVQGEVPPMRYSGQLKDFGPNYVRTIMPGNDDAPDGYTWLTYSMNKEDIWVTRLPAHLSAEETEPVCDVFVQMDGPVPEKWHVYSPLWAQVTLEEGCLVLRDSDPWDYAKAMRNFPECRCAQAHMQVTPYSIGTGRMEVEVTDGSGKVAARLILAEDGTLRARGGDRERIIGQYQDGEMLDVELRADCGTLQMQIAVNGQVCGTWPLMCPVRTLERLVLRTGKGRMEPTMENDPADGTVPAFRGGERAEEAQFKVYQVTVK